MANKKRREPDSHMEIDIEDKRVDLAVFLDKEFKSIRYELTSEKEIKPQEAAFCLWLLLKAMCQEAGTTPQELIASFSEEEEINTTTH